MPETITVERDENISIVLMNRPELFNAFDIDMVRSFADHLVALSTDDDVLGVVIKGEGKAFCAGGDIRWVCDFPGGPPAAFHTLAS